MCASSKSRAPWYFAPLLGLADGIVDIVETGTTLKENGLEGCQDIARYLGASHRKHRQP